MILIDRSIPKSVAEALKQVRNDVIWLEDRFEHDEVDSVWLAEAGWLGWIAILRDKKIRTREGERRAIQEHGGGCFILNQNNNPTKWEYLKLLASTLDDMERLDRETPRPYIFTVSREGIMRQVLRP